MKKEVGLWLDRRRAVIVTLNDGTETVEYLDSNVEKRVRYSGKLEGTSNIPYDDYAEDKRDRRINDHLTQYYERIVPYLQDATALLIMGPGEAKIEFQKHLQNHNVPVTIHGVEAADKLTDAQIVARVRGRFEQQPHSS